MKRAFILASEVVFLHHTGKCLENGESVIRGIEGAGRDKIWKYAREFRYDKLMFEFLWNLCSESYIEQCFKIQVNELWLEPEILHIFYFKQVEYIKCCPCLVQTNLESCLPNHLMHQIAHQIRTLLCIQQVGELRDQSLELRGRKLLHESHKQSREDVLVV